MNIVDVVLERINGKGDTRLRLCVEESSTKEEIILFAESLNCQAFGWKPTGVELVQAGVLFYRPAESY